MLDLNSGRVYGVEPAICNGCYIPEDPDPDKEHKGYVYWMDFQATCVEDWFERWLGGALEKPLSHVEGCEAPDEPEEML